MGETRPAASGSRRRRLPPARSRWAAL